MGSNPCLRYRKEVMTYMSPYMASIPKDLNEVARLKAANRVICC